MKINLWHVLAFLVGTIGIIAGIVSPMLQTGAVTVGGVFAAVSAQSGLIWALFLRTVMAPGAAQKRGFARAGLLGALSVAAVLLALVVIPRRVAHEYGPSTSNAAVVVQAEGQGCGWLNSGGGAVIAQQGEAEVECVLAQVLAGGNVPLDILVNCAAGAFNALFSDLGSLIQYYLSGVADGGASSAPAGMTCAAPGAKPPAGAVLPSCIPTSALAALQAKHDEVHARLAGGAK